MTDTPVLTHVTYRPLPGKEDALFTLVQKHWPTIHRLGLTTDTPANVYRAQDKQSGCVSFIEIFSWKSEEASDVAHQMPEVMAIWEPMDPLLDDLQLQALEVVEAAD